MITRMRAISFMLGVATLALVSVTSTACRREVAASPETADGKQVATRTVAMPVDGMICQVCAGGLKSVLKAVHGVQNVEVSLQKRNAVIHYEEGTVNVEQLTAAITDLGLKPGVPTPIRAQ